jgi:hypothetical protein
MLKVKIFAVIWVLISLAIVMLALMDYDAMFRLYYSNGVQLFAAYVSAVLCYRTMWVFPSATPLRFVWGLVGRVYWHGLWGKRILRHTRFGMLEQRPLIPQWLMSVFY